MNLSLGQIRTSQNPRGSTNANVLYGIILESGNQNLVSNKSVNALPTTMLITAKCITDQIGSKLYIVFVKASVSSGVRNLRKM